MAMNRIQFQLACLCPDFCNSLAPRRNATMRCNRLAEPQGFRSFRCGQAERCLPYVGAHKAFQRQQACRFQASLIAGTLFQSSVCPAAMSRCLSRSYFACRAMQIEDLTKTDVNGHGSHGEGEADQAIELIVLRKRLSASTKKTLPIAIRARNCGQTMLKPAPR